MLALGSGVLTGVVFAQQAGPPPAELAAPAAPPAAAPAAQTFNLTLPLVFQGAYVGDLPVEASADGKVSVKVDRFIELLGERLSSDLISALKDAAGSNEYAPIEVFADTGVQVAYDASSLELRVTIPLELQGGQSVSALQQSELGAPSLATTAPEWFSASVTLTARQSYNHGPSGEDGFGPVRVAGDLAANFFGADGIYLFAEGQYVEGAVNAFQRGNVTAIYDDRDSAIRYAAGDVAPFASGFQGAPILGGLSIQRAYAELQPFTNIRPSGLFSFTLDRASTVDVVVNGATIRTIKLEPGQYNLRDFPFFNGLNEVELYLVDDFGRRLLARFNQFFSAQLLDEGIFEFGITAGYPQLRDPDGEISYEEDNLTISGFARYGLIQDITVGANYQMDQDQSLYGAELAWASPIGTLAAIASWSKSDLYGEGHAYLFSYEFSAESLAFLERPQINLEYQRTSEFFTVLGETTLSNPYDYEARGRFSAQMPYEIGLGLSASYAHGRSIEPDELRYGVSLSRSIGFASLTASFERQRREGEIDDDRYLITLTMPLGPSENVRGSYDSRNDLYSVEYSRFERNEVGDYGIRAQIQRDNDQITGAGEVTYNANRFGVTLQHDIITNDGGDIISQVSSYEIATQVAIAGGKVGFGRPVGSRFALISGHETLEGRTVSVKEGQGRERPNAQTDFLGPALAPAGNAYVPNQVLVEVEDLPPGYDIGPGQYDFFPGPAAGYDITVGSDASRVVLGTLMGPDGKPAALLGGELHSLDDPDMKPLLVFTNSAGRFVAQGVAPGRYEAVLGPDGAIRFQFAVDEDQVGLVDLGTVQAAR
jgi:outer membrane usher protein